MQTPRAGTWRLPNPINESTSWEFDRNSAGSKSRNQRNATDGIKINDLGRIARSIRNLNSNSERGFREELTSKDFTPIARGSVVPIVLNYIFILRDHFN